MTTITRKPLLAAELTVTASDSAYTSPANTRTQVVAATITNKTATARHATVTITPSGGSARNVCYQRVIAPHESFVVYGLIGQILGPGDKFEAAGEAASALDMVVSGYEVN